MSVLDWSSPLRSPGPRPRWGASVEWFQNMSKLRPWSKKMSNSHAIDECYQFLSPIGTKKEKYLDRQGTQLLRRGTTLRQDLIYLELAPLFRPSIYTILRLNDIDTNTVLPSTHVERKCVLRPTKPPKKHWIWEVLRSTIPPDWRFHW